MLDEGEDTNLGFLGGGASGREEPPHLPPLPIV